MNTADHIINYWDYLGFTLEVIGLVCLVTGAIDMGMNGGAGGWANFALPTALACFVALYFMGWQ